MVKLFCIIVVIGISRLGWDGLCRVVWVNMFGLSCLLGLVVCMWIFMVWVFGFSIWVIDCIFDGSIWLG